MDFRTQARALMDAGKPIDAAAELARGGDFEGAAKVLFREERYGDAAQLLVRSLGVPMTEVGRLPEPQRRIAERAASYFVKAGDHQGAAMLLKALGDHEQANRHYEAARARSRPVPQAPQPVREEGIAEARAYEQRGGFEQAAQIYARIGAKTDVERLVPSLPPRVAAAALALVGSLLRAAQLCLAVDDKLTAYECLVRVPASDPQHAEACMSVMELVWPTGFADARLLDFLAPWADNPWPAQEDILALTRVALLRKKIGRHDAARELLQNLLNVAPGFQPAVDALAQMTLVPSPVIIPIPQDPDQTAERVFSDSLPSAEATLVELGQRVASSLQHDSLVAGRYRIARQIGAGNVGVLFEALDEKLNERVALKFLQPQADHAAIARFKREIIVSRKLVHPNIVSVFDLGNDGDKLYVTMELLAGEDLAERKKRPMDMQIIVEVLRQTCRGLQAAHAHNIVHRDVKPANIFLVDNGIVKLTDFGLARDPTQPGLTLTGQFVGTPRYMAPESFLGEANTASDLYSLGVTAYEVLCGRPPFDEREPLPLMWKHAGERPVPVIERNRSVPPELSDLVNRLLAKLPAERPASAAATADELDRIHSWLVLNAPTQVDDAG
jgi:tetratricopeptide (TPR) repeat protein